MVHLSISHPAPPPLLILLSGSDTFVLGFVCLRGWQTKYGWTLFGLRTLAKKKTGVPWKKRGHQIEYAREAKGRAFLSESCGITGTQFNVYRLLEQHEEGCLED